MRLYQLTRTSRNTRLRYGPKSTPMVSLITSTSLWRAGWDAAALRPFSAAPPPRLPDAPSGVPASAPDPGCAARGMLVAGAAGTLAISGWPGRTWAGAVAAAISATAFCDVGAEFRVGANFA